MTTGLPSQTQVIELLGGEFARAGYEIEDVVIDTRARPPRINVIADGDTALDLDTIAALSRSASALLDGLDGIRDRYVLEVSSPGVDRPLTDPRHWRRAVGRLVQVTAADAGPISGRVLAADADGVTLDVAGDHRRFGYAALGAGAIQVEFGHPQTELGATGDGH